MGIIDRRYNDDIPKKCPKTGHWTGVSNCSECDYAYCPVRKLPYVKHTNSPNLESLYNFNVKNNSDPPKDSKPNPEPIINKSKDNIPNEPKTTTDNKIKDNTQANKRMPTNQRKPLIPKWLTTLLSIFACSIVGIILDIVIHNSIPFYLLLGFSLIFSIEKWFNYDTRKHKEIGILYRLVLNLGILSLLGLIIWSGIKLFSHQFVQSALVGSILFMAEFVLFIWLWRVVAKNSWRKPSMKLTVFSLIALSVVFSFAGVQPLARYKDAIFNKIKSASADNQSFITYPSTTTPTTAQPIQTALPTAIQPLTATNIPITVLPIITTKPTITSISPLIQGINPTTGTYKNYYLGLADSSGGDLSGDGCYDDKGNFIVLINNKNATNPTYAQLVNFLQNDKTDEYPYTYTNLSGGFYYGTAESRVDLKNIQNIIDGIAQPKNPDVCADFAERLHNDAEMASIRCAYVSLDITGYPDPNHLGIPSDSGHALDAFQTTDRGLVYIDDTGWVANQPHPNRAVKIANPIVGQEYIPTDLFPEAGWNTSAESMGTVTNVETTWDGTWNGHSGSQ